MASMEEPGKDCLFQFVELVIKQQRGGFMGITVTIGTSERDVKEIEPNWITEQIVRRKQDGVPVCVIVKIKTNGLDMVLASGDCPSGGGPGGRPPTQQEREIFALWEKLHLKQGDISPGNLIAFLKQVSS